MVPGFMRNSTPHGLGGKMLFSRCEAREVKSPHNTLFKGFGNLYKTKNLLGVIYKYKIYMHTNLLRS